MLSTRNLTVIVDMGAFTLELYHTGAEVNDKNNLFCFAGQLAAAAAASSAMMIIVDSSFINEYLTAQ